MSLEHDKAWAAEIKRLQEMKRYEQALYDAGIRYVAGIDEAGRGPIAGPVVAALSMTAVAFVVLFAAVMSSVISGLVPALQRRAVGAAHTRAGSRAAVDPARADRTASGIG